MDCGAIAVKPLILFAIGRIIFGAAALVAPAPAGAALAGAGGAGSGAQAFLRGMGGRDIGLGLGILTMLRVGGSLRPWLLACVLADSSDVVGVAGAWQNTPSSKRWLGLATAGGAAALGAGLLATLDNEVKPD
jgi:hypothetical protein